MSIDLLNLGSAPDDGNGQDLRSGGQVINDNFAELDTRTSAAQAAADAAERTLVAGENILIDRTDPDHPVISASGGGAGTVQTVAGVTPDGGGDIPSAGLSSAIGLDNKVDKVPGKGLSSTDFTSAEKTKLAGVATDATKNATDAALRDRATHTGTQLAATISDLAATVRAVLLTGLDTSTNAVLTAADTVLSGLGKLQKQLSDAVVSIANKANKGANSDITSLSGLTTPLSVAQGGTGSTTGVPTLAGATASTAGAKGLVPAPAVGDQLKFLRGDGTFQAVTASTVWGGVTGTLSAQTDLQAALDLKLDKSDATPIKSYASPDQTITPGGSLTLLHQLGSEPFEVQGFIVCRDADAEYAVGDVVPVPHFAVDYAYNYGVSLVTSSTSIFCRFGTAAGAFFVLRKTTATTVGIVPAKWRFIVRART